MTKNLCILILEDEPADFELTLRALRAQGIQFTAKQVMTEADFQAELRNPALDLILADYALPSYDGQAALALAARERPEVPFIFVSGTMGEEVAIEALHNGAIDYVLKHQLGRLGPAVRRALHEVEAHREQQEAKTALRQSENFRVAILDSIPVAVWFINLRGEVQFSNSFDAMLWNGQKALSPGLIPDYKSWYRQLLERVFDEEWAVCRCLSQRRSLSDRPHEVVCFDGKSRTILHLAVPLRDGLSNELLGAIAIHQDITELSAAEAQIREQANLLDLTDDAVCVRDLTGRILYWNKGSEKLYGRTAADALRPDTKELICSDASSRVQTCLEETLKNGRWSGELVKLSDSGQKLIVQSRWTLMKSDSKRAQSVLIAETDITEKKQVEAQFLRAQRLESVGQLAGGIAHDLNNILAPILMVAPLLRAELFSREAQSWLDTVQSSAQRGADVVRQLLAFARGVQGEKIPLQPRALIREVTNLISETFPKSIKLNTRFSKDLWLVLGDITQLHQLLLNLAVNARDAMPEGGTLTLAADNVTLDEQSIQMLPGTKPGPHVMLSVADTGTGIPPEIADKVFDPFFTTKEPDKGTGLGLSTVAAIVKGHGGFVTLASEAGRGTEFKVYLPAAPAAAVCAPPPTKTAPPRGTGELILIVDDEPSIRTVTECTLKSAGYRTRVAKDGMQGLAVYRQHQTEIALVLTDLNMPNQDGAATIAALRQLNPQLPIIVATGLDSSSDLRSAGELGVQARLKKPFQAVDLLAAISEALHSLPENHHAAAVGVAGPPNSAVQ